MLTMRAHLVEAVCNKQQNSTQLEKRSKQYVSEDTALHACVVYVEGSSSACTQRSAPQPMCGDSTHGWYHRCQRCLHVPHSLGGWASGFPCFASLLDYSAAAFHSSACQAKECPQPAATQMLACCTHPADLTLNAHLACQSLTQCVVLITVPFH